MKTSLVLSILLGCLLGVSACSGAPKTSTVTEGTGNSTYGGGDDVATPPEDTGSGAEARGQACPSDGSCPADMQCVTYYGIAGPNRPAFTSCETPCDKGGACPDGLACITVADGPGQVCR
jgi:hypothetical protein